MRSGEIGSPCDAGAGAGGCPNSAGALGLALALGCLLASAESALAEDKPLPPPAEPPAASEQIDPASVIRLLGRDVKSASGEVVAQIINLLVDSTGQPRAAILDYGGFLCVGKRRIAVAWRVLSFAPGAAGTITLGLDRDQLKNFPEYKSDGPVVAAAPPGDIPAGPEPVSPPAPETSAPPAPGPSAPAAPEPSAPPAPEAQPAPAPQE